MNQNSVTDYLLLMNNNIIAQETLLEYHLKAEALLRVLLSSKLSSYSLATLHHYLWNLSDVIVKAKDLNELLLDTLVKTTRPPKKDPEGRG